MTDIRKFMNVVERGETDAEAPVARDEAGRVLHPDVSYEVNASKVVATLKSYKSQSYTKLAQKIEEIEELDARIDALKEEVKQEGRDAIADLFSAEDTVRTRVIDTVSFVMQITKDPAPAKTVKYAKVIEELATHLTPELKAVMESLVKKYETTQEAKPAALKYNSKPKTESVDLTEGVWDKVRAVLAKFKDFILGWANKYDAKLDALKAQVAMGEAIDSLEAPVVEAPEFKAPESFFKQAMMKGSEEVAEAQEEEVAAEPTMEDTMADELATMIEAAGAFSRGDVVYSGSKQGKVVGTVVGKPESMIIELPNGERDVVPTASLTLEKPSMMKRAFSAVVGEEAVEEAGHDPYNHVGKDFQRPEMKAWGADPRDGAKDGFGEAEMVSKWKTPKGSYAYVWRKAMGSDEGVVINATGKQVELHGNPKKIADIEHTLETLYGATRDSKELSLSLADSEDVAPEAEEQGLTEYQGANTEDMFPVAATLSDEELKHYADWVQTLKHSVDPESEMGQAFSTFAGEVAQECQTRGIC